MNEKNHQKKRTQNWNNVTQTSSIHYWIFKLCHFFATANACCCCWLRAKIADFGVNYTYMIFPANKKKIDPRDGSMHKVNEKINQWLIFFECVVFGACQAFISISAKIPKIHSVFFPVCFAFVFTIFRLIFYLVRISNRSLQKMGKTNLCKVFCVFLLSRSHSSLDHN